MAHGACVGFKEFNSCSGQGKCCRFYKAAADFVVPKNKFYVQNARTAQGSRNFAVSQSYKPAGESVDSLPYAAAAEDNEEVAVEAEEEEPPAETPAHEEGTDKVKMPIPALFGSYAATLLVGVLLSFASSSLKPRCRLGCRNQTARESSAKKQPQAERKLVAAKFVNNQKATKLTNLVAPTGVEVNVC